MCQTAWDIGETMCYHWLRIRWVEDTSMEDNHGGIYLHCHHETVLTVPFLISEFSGALNGHKTKIHTHKKIKNLASIHSKISRFDTLPGSNHTSINSICIQLAKLTQHAILWPHSWSFRPKPLCNQPPPQICSVNAISVTDACSLLFQPSPLHFLSNFLISTFSLPAKKNRSVRESKNIPANHSITRRWLSTQNYSLARMLGFFFEFIVM